jgi:hypothetical protein
MPRGSRQDKRGRLKWRNKQATSGRRGGLGSKPRFTSYKQVQAAIRRNRTVIVCPPKEEREAAKDAAVAEAEAAAPAAE